MQAKGLDAIQKISLVKNRIHGAMKNRYIHVTTKQQNSHPNVRTLILSSKVLLFLFEH